MDKKQIILESAKITYAKWRDQDWDAICQNDSSDRTYVSGTDFAYMGELTDVEKHWQDSPDGSSVHVIPGTLQEEIHEEAMLIASAPDTVMMLCGMVFELLGEKHPDSPK